MKKPIRILHVFGELNMGGAETLVMNLYRNINRSKVQFDFVVHTKEKGSYEEEIKRLGGRIYRFPRYVGYNHFKYCKKWREFLAHHKEFKIVHGHIRSTAAIYLRIANKFGITTIAHSHSTANGVGLQAFIKDIYQIPLRGAADYYFAASKDAGEWLFGHKILNSNRFFLLRNAINVDDFAFDQKIRRNIRNEFDVDYALVLGHVGRFTEAKNHKMLIKIFNEFFKINSNAKLWLVGIGSLENEIYELVKENNLEDSVFFFGERKDVNQLMMAMDAFIFPSIYEGLGIVTIEAQNSGLLTVVSDRIPEEANLTDLFIKVKLDEDPKEWAKIISSELSNSKMRDNYSEYIKKAGFDIITKSKELEKFYLEC